MNDLLKTGVRSVVVAIGGILFGGASVVVSVAIHGLRVDPNLGILLNFGMLVGFGVAGAGILVAFVCLAALVFSD